MKKQILIFLLLISAVTFAKNNAFQLGSGQQVVVAVDDNEEKVVKTALELLQRDIQNVLSASMTTDVKGGNIIVATVGKSNLTSKLGISVSSLKNKKQAFILAVNPSGKLVVAGSDKFGTAYGIIEITRLLGVSPWEWWADAVPVKKEKFELAAGFRTVQSPSVEYRGIFINDEDWGMLPWSNQNYEPTTDKSHIGPRTNEKMFELLLRLRANAFWPAMHECTLPYFMTPGNVEAAEKYGIFVGTSHCEPMMCNAAGEWKRRGKGDYDYVKNSHSVFDFWEKRVKEVSGYDNIYTVGMRGVHDGEMQGAKTLDEQRVVLDRVFKDQRELISKYVNKDVTKVPQIFVPYKEVLDIYNTGLKVPEDVSLVWCDDNYGYITHFPNDAERARSGGNGVYYHASYWGRPHDYLWLGTASPALEYQQLNLAYDKGIQKIWILNVGDLKPAEYQIDLFMDMAWDIQKSRKEGVKGHLSQFLTRELGAEIGNELTPVMDEHFRLAYIRKPEFMGNTREEESDPKYRVIKDLPWTENEVNARLADYKSISDKVEMLAKRVNPLRVDEYFQLVKYPVQATAQMNVKLLNAQLARHSKSNWDISQQAFDSIASLTKIYNNDKWKGMMDFQPRRLPVFERVKETVDPNPMFAGRKALYKWNGTECSGGQPIVFEGLGYNEKAAGVQSGKSLTYAFENIGSDSADVEIRLLPNHPVNGKDLRIVVSVDGNPSAVTSYRTFGRSEEWKENVLSNQAVRKFTLPLKKENIHQLTVQALDEGVVVDQIFIYNHQK